MRDPLSPPSTGAGLDALLSRGRPVLLDGATGTELARRGVDTTLPLWSARALFDDHGLEILTTIHEDYARAGAEILVTDTFRTALRTLERAGRRSSWREANRRAVECARAGSAAGASACLIAGGLAPLEDCYRPDLVPAREECRREHGRQADLLASLDVDLIVIETMNSLREAEASLEAAVGTGLPVLLSLCPRPPARLLSGEPLAQAVPRLVALGGDALRGILLNCATPEALETIFPSFVALAPGLPHGLYAHLGEPDEITGWRLPDRHDPGRYAEWIARQIGGGARLVGGCCGTTPDHIAAIAERLAGPAAD